MQDPIIQPVSPAALASQLPKPKPSHNFEGLQPGYSQILPLEGADLKWIRNAAKWCSRPRKNEPQRTYRVVVHKENQTVEIARLA